MIRFNKLLEFTKGEVREDGREIARLRRKISIGEAGPADLVELAELYLRKRDSATAEKYLREVITRPGCDEPSLLDACNMLERIGRYEQAFEGF
ncbi:MAG: hypothetical protein PHQ19_08680, partial [Candidatus Krumholzibacteria bacterium]|nr:hypothetical protein [Candidatus Krumholzibacteria bacterium]